MTVAYNIRFIDSVRFMASSPKNLTDNLAVGLHKDQCKNCEPCLKSANVKGDSLIFIDIFFETEFYKDLAKYLQKRTDFVVEIFTNFI